MDQSDKDWNESNDINKIIWQQIWMEYKVALLHLYNSLLYSVLRLSTGSNPQVRVPVGRYLHVPNPKPTSTGFWRAGNPNPRV